MDMETILPLLLLAWVANAEPQPTEIGTVTWEREYPRALTLAEESGKPVFLLFQEVPGCAGCRAFGREVLSRPELVSLIESHFVPLVVYNNRGGGHERIRKRYREPAWNYQVVRFVDAKGKDLIPRKDKVWTTSALAGRMIRALEAADRPVPGELHTLAGHAPPGETATAAFAQSCFWTGERKLGALEGVLETEAGFIRYREVTRVVYDPAVITYENLRKQAERMRCASQSYPRLPEEYRPAPARDQKKQIQGTPFAQLTLTPRQATKVNAYARTHPKKAAQHVPDDQRELLPSSLR